MSHDADLMREFVRDLFARDEDAVRFALPAAPEPEPDPELRRFAAELFAQPTTKENS